jgi:nitrous oxidase accessory protein NosD
MFAAVMTSACGSALAQTLDVPQSYPSIQNALDAAPPGATVVVSPGTYRENLEINKPVTLRSLDGPKSTIIDGNRAGPVIVARGTGAERVVIDGFTITNGLNYSTIPFGSAPAQAAGIFLQSVVAVVTDNIIRDNVGCLGSGISTLTAALTLQRNQILNNATEPRCDGADGGGVFLRGEGNGPTLVANNIIAGNRISGRGAGIGVQGMNAVTIRENIIRGNQSSGAGGSGGGILINLSGASIIANLLAGNAAEVGGAMALFPIDSANRVVMTGNLMLNNTASLQGSALFLSVPSQDSLRMTTNLVEGSSAVSLVECSGPFAVARTNLLRNSAGPDLGGACTRGR